MENFIIKFNSVIGLRHNLNNQYLNFNRENNSLEANGAHPYINVKNKGVSITSNREFIIQSSISKDSKGIVTFGSGIMLMTRNGEYLLGTSKGELRLEKPKQDVQRDISETYFNMAKWTILDATNSQSRRQVTVFDTLLIKSKFDYFLSVEGEFSLVSAGQKNIQPNTIWKIEKATTPFMPDWVYLRPNLSSNYLNHELELHMNSKLDNYTQKTNLDDKNALGSMEIQNQELYLIEDILYTMMSIEGTYIKKKFDPVNKNKYDYCIEPQYQKPTCENSLAQLSNKILPISYYHDRVEVFINTHSSFDFGSVSQALCAALRQLMREYLLFVNQMDTEFCTGQLTLQKLWFYVQNSLKIMECLMNLCESAVNLKGGALLGQIYQMMSESSDNQNIQIYKLLLQRSFIPYMNIFSNWIYDGIVDDQFEEFLIQEKEDIKKENINEDFKDNFWQKRFTIRDNQVPLFLSQFQQEILLTGKFINVIRDAKIQLNCPFSHDLSNNFDYLIETQNFSEPIMRAYDFANQEIIKLCLEKQQLMERLKSIKKYFFLELGDFFIHLMDAAESEFNKSYKQLSKDKLQNLLEISLQTSSANGDIFKDDLECDLDPYTLLEKLFALQNINKAQTFDSSVLKQNQNQLKGYDVFTLNYNIKWPLNLIITSKSMQKYQMIFRSLFFSKFVERQLSQTWKFHQQIRELKLKNKLQPSFYLTQKMIHFSKNLIYHLSYEVLEEKFIKMEKSMKQVKKFDEIIQIHEKFLDDCLKSSFLLDSQIIVGITKLNNTCLIFSNIIQQFTDNLKLDSETIQSKQKNPLEKRKNNIELNSITTLQLIEDQQHQAVIQNFQKTFDSQLKELIVSLENSKFDIHIQNLLQRLDFDDFYSQYFGLKSKNFQSFNKMDI